MSQRLAEYQDGLPPGGHDLLAHWRAARRSAVLPPLRDIAPIGLPAAMLPWTLTYRRDAEGNLTYGVVGEELVTLFGENPRGKMVLGYAEAAERQRRYERINQALDTGTPYLSCGGVLFDNAASLELARIGLPTRGDTAPVLVLVYFPLGPLPFPRLKVASFGPVDSGSFRWLTEYRA